MSVETIPANPGFSVVCFEPKGPRGEATKWPIVAWQYAWDSDLEEPRLWALTALGERFPTHELPKDVGIEYPDGRVRMAVYEGEIITREEHHRDLTAAQLAMWERRRKTV